MPRDGSGDYSRAVSPYVNGNVASATDVNTEMDDIASALTASVNTAGTKAMAGNLVMGGNKVTGLGAGSANGDAVRYEQVSAILNAGVVDADISGLAGLSTNGAVFRTGSGVYTIRSITGSANITVSNGDGVSGAPTISASGLLVASNNLSDLGSATTARTNLGLGTAAVVNTGTSGGTAALNNGANTWSALQKFTSGLYNATFTARFEGTDSPPAGATGVGLELFQDGTNCVVQAFNRSSPAFSPIDFKGSSFTFSNGIQAPVLVSSETSGSLTSASRNKQVHCSGGVTLPSSGMTDGDFIVIDPRGTARTITRPGGHTMYVANADVATATTGAHNICVAKYHGSSKWSIGGSVS